MTDHFHIDCDDCTPTRHCEKGCLAHSVRTAVKTYEPEYVQLVVTIPIRRSDLDLSATAAKKAMEQAAYLFWGMARGGTSDLTETGAADIAQPIYADNGRDIIAIYRIEGVN